MTTASVAKVDIPQLLCKPQDDDEKAETDMRTMTMAAAVPSTAMATMANAATPAAAAAELQPEPPLFSRA
ncbi:hypothetical protein FQN54_001046 [Arachnomyces sp. PD_36]|nr:hypothetical protein FQN54_001046 [Arachnomyces sp. PD_36]